MKKIEARVIHAYRGHVGETLESCPTCALAERERQVRIAGEVLADAEKEIAALKAEIAALGWKIKNERSKRT